MADELVLDAEKAAKRAKQMVVLAGILVGIVVAVVFIDQGLKKQILGEHDAAKRTLEQFRELVAKQAEVEAGNVYGRAKTAGEAGGAPSADLNGSGGVGDDAPPGTHVAKAPAPAKRAPANRAARTPRRAQGDG